MGLNTQAIEIYDTLLADETCDADTKRLAVFNKF